MPQSERVRVLKGELKKTSGGLTAKDLVRNKRGKVVSRKKSDQAGGDNNLGSWLRSKGDKFQGKPKGFKAEEVDDRDDEKVGELPAPKPKKKRAPPPKAAPKKAAKKKAVVVDLTDSPVKAKKAKKKRLEPMKPGEKKSAKVSVGNILDPKSAASKKEAVERERKLMRGFGFSDKEIDEMLKGGSMKLSAKVRRTLKASKRRGKRRTKKQILQDVLDV